jgi:hypothetical protein
MRGTFTTKEGKDREMEEHGCEIFEREEKKNGKDGRGVKAGGVGGGQRGVPISQHIDKKSLVV